MFWGFRHVCSLPRKIVVGVENCLVYIKDVIITARQREDLLSSSVFLPSDTRLFGGSFLYKYE